ncbi:hypothetical protein VNO77_03182 [Canavalia gladiata]|uniref:Uncharacterized protein n=1 Tax=Canavalia gladiata TaxID=3824 RepID=A0AAN9MUE0_CANGL
MGHARTHLSFVAGTMRTIAKSYHIPLLDTTWNGPTINKHVEGVANFGMKSNGEDRRKVKAFMRKDKCRHWLNSSFQECSRIAPNDNGVVFGDCDEATRALAYLEGETKRTWPLDRRIFGRTLASGLNTISSTSSTR